MAKAPFRLAIAVARRDSILWEEGLGWADRDARVPVTTNSPFYLASLTKTITATALMLLHERGGR
jgi:CubicO group peptidase (beta-lactamase class C family)